jgi:hypothetical protein
MVRHLMAMHILPDQVVIVVVVLCSPPGMVGLHASYIYLSVMGNSQDSRSQKLYHENIVRMSAGCCTSIEDIYPAPCVTMKIVGAAWKESVV